MKLLQFPNKNKIKLTKMEFERFQELKIKLENSIHPSEAKYYKSELDLLVEMGRNKK